MAEVIVTYGDNDSVGKKMLRDYFRKRNTLYKCQCCRGMFERSDDRRCLECSECFEDPNILPWR